jgi:hypothetical protein
MRNTAETQHPNVAAISHPVRLTCRRKAKIVPAAAPPKQIPENMQKQIVSRAIIYSVYRLVETILKSPLRASTTNGQSEAEAG